MGAAHTQWWDHDTGEASSMANAARPVPSTRSPRRHHTAPTVTTASASGPATASHSRVGGGPSSSRVSAPNTDWLYADSGGPTRPALTRSSTQYVFAEPGITANPIATVPAKARSARPAVVRRPASSSSTTNTSGVSFTPAATPTSTPDQRRSGRTRSMITASISNTLTWPNVRFCHTGSRASAAPVSSANRHPDAVRPSARPTTRMTPASAPTDAAVHSAATSQPGSSASGTMATAANGG